MEISSRYRTAMNEIDALKKELAIHKKFSVESLSSPIQYSTTTSDEYRISSNSKSMTVTGSSPSSDSFDIKSASRKPKNLPQDSSSPAVISVASSMSRLAESRKQTAGLLAENRGQSTDTTKASTTTRATSPSMVPNPVTPDSDEESPISTRSGSSDSAFGELHSEDFFQHTYKTTLAATPEKENVDVESMNQQFENFGVSSGSSEKKSDGEKNSNSFDAFEASFNTEFPTSFSESVSPAKKSKFADNDFSDSFFMDPSMNSTDTSRRSSHSSNRLDMVPDDEMDAPMDEAQSLFPTSAFDFDENKSKNQNANVNDSVESLPMDEANDTDEHSPSMVLKVLQQRKARHSMSPNESGSTPSSNKSRTSQFITEEIKKLDAIANGSTPTSSRERRRNVKQPISYAEPSLSSKLRRGDVFFPKKNAEDNTLKDRQTNKNTPHTELHAYE